VDQLPCLQAEEQLLRSQAADMPHLEEKDRKTTYERLQRLTEFGLIEEPTVTDPTSVAGRSKLGSMGIGVKVVKR
jgi:hypothetical protein